MNIQGTLMQPVFKISSLNQEDQFAFKLNEPFFNKPNIDKPLMASLAFKLNESLINKASSAIPSPTRVSSLTLLFLMHWKRATRHFGTTTSIGIIVLLIAFFSF